MHSKIFSIDSFMESLNQSEIGQFIEIVVGFVG